MTGDGATSADDGCELEIACSLGTGGKQFLECFDITQSVQRWEGVNVVNIA